MLPILYLAAAGALLACGTYILRIHYRRVFRRNGRLTRPAMLLGTGVWFALGGFPAIYLPGDWPAVHLPPLLAIGSWTLLGGGLLLMFAGIATLGFRASFGQGRKEVKARGLYSLSRNPQIIGCAGYCWGFFLLWPSWYAAGWLFIFIILAHSMVLTEEEHLGRLFGRAYLDYCNQVPRYLRLASPGSKD